MDVAREVGLTAAFSSSLMASKTRTSKILRKVGQFRSIFLKKPNDGPYMAMSPKPFMSQPMLPMEMTESDGSSHSEGDNLVGRHSISTAQLAPVAGPSRNKLVKPSPAASRSSLRLTTSEEPVRPNGLPMPLHRFSFTLNEDKGSVRLSPAIITRQPMQILNLPTLPVPAPTPRPSERRQSQLRLRHMPVLGLSPDDQPEDNQNDEDLEDMMEDAEETDEDAEEVFVDPPEDPTEGEYDESGMPRSSTSSETRPPSRASYMSLHQVPSTLPLIDTSRLDLSFLNKSPSPTTMRMFDKGKTKAGDPGVTPTAKRPTRYQNTDYFSFSSQESGTSSTNPTATNDTAQLPDSSMETPRPGDAFRLPSFLRSSAAHDVSTRPSMYKHASKSMVNFHSRPSLDEAKLVQRNTHSIFTNKSKQSHPDTESSSNSRIVNLNEDDDNVPLGVVRAAAAGTTSTTTTITTINLAPEQQHPSLRRRGSMPTFLPTSLPPPYPDFLSSHQSKSHPQTAASSATMGGEECEGKEKLPAYSNSIYLRAIMPRKMEFAAPGVQAKDRKWRRVLCELEGTVFRVYKCPAAGTLGEWWENKIGVGDVSVVGNGSATYNPSVAGRQTETESVAKLVDERIEGNGQTELRIPQPGPSSSSSTSLASPVAASEMNENPSKSRFSSFLKPKTHNRSRSDMPNAIPKSPRSPRGSFSIPRPSFGSSSSGSGSSHSNFLVTSSSSPAMTSPSQSNSSLTVSIPPHTHNVDSGRTPRTSSSHNTLATSAQEVPLGSASLLVKAYTLQHSESGLANDYLKRKNVIRVRMEGQQFLLQARDIGAVVEWIEGFQAASNVALDLDERMMPKGPMFPRRRRRRQRRAENADETQT